MSALVLCFMESLNKLNFLQQMFYDWELPGCSERLQPGYQTQQKDSSSVFKQSCMSSEAKKPSQGHWGFLSGLYCLCVIHSLWQSVLHCSIHETTFKLHKTRRRWRWFHISVTYPLSLWSKMLKVTTKKKKKLTCQSIDICIIVCWTPAVMYWSLGNLSF